uniref:Zinc finger protein NUTCRACKER-like isoform X1 n=1 Tax=Rhizophora mucronata TaxID=61149 RepID=A0A2P2M5K1_RHIMU
MNNLSPQLYPTSLEQSFLPHENPSLSPGRHPFAMNFHSPAASPHMSATALLQKAAQMGVTLSKPSPISPAEAASSTFRPRQAHDMSEITAGFTGSSSRSFYTYTAGSGHDLGLSSREAMGSGLGHGSVSFRNKAAVASAGTMMECVATSAAPSLVHNMMNGSFSSSVNATGFAAGPSFDGNFQETLSSSGGSQLRRCDQEGGATAAAGGLRGGGGGGGGGNDSLTRDFLGLRSFSHKDFLNMTAIDHVGSSSIYRQQDQNQAPWRG